MRPRRVTWKTHGEKAGFEEHEGGHLGGDNNVSRHTRGRARSVWGPVKRPGSQTLPGEWGEVSLKSTRHSVSALFFRVRNLNAILGKRATKGDLEPAGDLKKVFGFV